MANMFSGKAEKRIPKDLSECTKSDATVSNLHYWSERLENWGQILFVILIIIGIISTIAETINMADINEDMAFITCITSAITWGLYAFIEYCAYHVLALLISALASITQNSIITANVALLYADNDPTIPKAAAPNPSSPTFIRANVSSQSNEQKSTWSCCFCGNSNKSSYTSCEICGNDRI